MVSLVLELSTLVKVGTVALVAVAVFVQTLIMVLVAMMAEMVNEEYLTVVPTLRVALGKEQLLESSAKTVESYTLVAAAVVATFGGPILSRPAVLAVAAQVHGAVRHLVHKRQARAAQTPAVVVVAHTAVQHTR